MSGCRCIICNENAELVFEKKIFSKNVKYFRCSYCEFLFTERPAYWLEQAYSNAITSLDLGLINRNLIYAEVLAWFIKICSNPSGKFVDFGGGYGMLTRIMRDKGFDFFRQDDYCENLFAKHFDITDIDTKFKADLVTSFEVFEHLENPRFEVQRMFDLGDTIFFSTEMLPAEDVENWYYLLPEIGQHISFYSRQSLTKLAQLTNSSYYNLTDSLHIFSRKKIPSAKLFLLKRLAINYIKILARLKMNTSVSLLSRDFVYVKEKLSNQKNS